MSTSVVTKPIETTDHQTIEMDESGNQRFAHIVRCPDEYGDVQAYLTLAAFEGFEVTALCGHTFLPVRDYKKYPVCKPCIEQAMADQAGQ